VGSARAARPDHDGDPVFVVVVVGVLRAGIPSLPLHAAADDGRATAATATDARFLFPEFPCALNTVTTNSGAPHPGRPRRTC